jgi:protein-export membrane protein SecD
MLHFPRWKVVAILAVLALGVIFSAPNLASRQWLDRLPAWAPKTVISLGLDLQGGSHLLLEVDTGDLLKEKLDGVVDEVRDKLRAAKIGYTNLGVVEGAVKFTLRNPADVDAARKELAPSTIGLDMEFGGSGDAAIRYGERALIDLKSHAVEQSIEIIRRRIDETGTKEPTIIRQGEDRIIVQLPGIKNPEHVKSLIGRTAKLVFRLVDEQAVLSGQVPPTSQWVEGADESEQRLPLQKRIMLTGENLVDAQQSFDSGGLPVVAFRFDSLGGRKFADVTSKNVGKRFAITLDDRIISAPVIRDAILGGSGIISGNFTVESARDLALLLRAGALPAPLSVLEERTVGADLGADSIAAGKNACIIGIVLIVVAMVVLYGLFGIFANLALVANAALLLGALSVLGATMTMPGIAGIVLTLGMAVDANVLILERVKEEVRNGRSPITAMEAGYREAQATIIDSNLTTLISTLMLFLFGTGPIKGFAVTLSVGIVTSVFTAVVVTRLMTSIWLRRARPKELPL